VRTAQDAFFLTILDYRCLFRSSIFIEPQSIHPYLLVVRKPLPLAKNARIKAMAAKAVDVANE
jgi:hypothetical protein